MTYVPPAIIPPTQLQIDTAVLKVKGMFYRLCWELVKEEQYGGKIDCCREKAKLFYLWRRSLSCQVVEVLGVGTIQMTGINGPPTLRHLEVFVNGRSISGPLATTSIVINTWMAVIRDAINAYQTTYVAFYNITTQVMTISGKIDGTLTITYTNTLIMEYSDVIGYVSPNGCLTDTEVFDLIGKINTACN